MNTKRMITLAMFFSCICMVTVLAQGTRGNATPEKRAVRMTERMQKELNLSKDQVDKVQSLNLQLAKDQTVAREKGKEGREDMKAAMQKYDNDLQKVLTPEQFKTHQENRQKARQQMQKRFNENGNQEPPK
jgi:periplasmic protein CpxP/Spy